MKKPAKARYDKTEDWDRLRKVFPDLPNDENHPDARRPTDRELALYFAAVGQGYFASVLRGFQGYVSDPIAYIAIRQNDLILARGRGWGIHERGRYDSWASETMQDWSEFYRLFGTLPGKNVPLNAG